MSAGELHVLEVLLTKINVRIKVQNFDDILQYLTIKAYKRHEEAFMAFVQVPKTGIKNIGYKFLSH